MRRSWCPRPSSARSNMDKVERAVDDIRRKWVPDGRLGVFDISIAPNVGAQHAAPLLSGVTSSRDARDALRRLANDQELVDKVELIPDAAGDSAAIVTAALAPLERDPKISAARVSEVLHGEVLADPRARRLHRLASGGIRCDRPDGLGRRLAETRHGPLAQRRHPDDRRSPPTADRRTRGAAARRRGAGGRPARRGGGWKYSSRAGAARGSASSSAAGAGAEVVLGRAVSLGRTHGVGHRLLRVGAGRVRRARDQAAARQRPAVRRRAGGRDGVGRRRVRGGRPAVLCGTGPRIACRDVGRNGAHRALGTVPGRGGWRQSVR